MPDPHRRVEEALRRFGLEEAADRPIRTYSGGMKKRLELAAATMHEPALLILDEPTAALDVQARYQIWGLIRQLNAQGTTVLLTTHYLEEADALCHRIGILDRGRLRALDSPALLKRRHGRARLRLTWSDPDAAAAALPLLADALDVQPSRLRAAGGLVEVPADDLVGALDLVFRALREQHLPPPDQVETLPPTLDQVFAQVTGSAVDPVTGEAFTLQDAAGADGTSGPTRTDSEAAAPPDADSQAVAVGEAGTVAGDTRPAPAAAASWRPGAFIRDNLTLLRRWWWRLRREPVEMIVTATQPALWLLIFGNLWERAALSWAEGGYLRFMTGGAVMMTVFNVALMGGLDLLLYRERGAMDRWLVTPVHPLALVTSRFTFVTALAAVQVLSTSPCSTTGSSTR